jgi:ubiquinone/menaquinone biosynthesis C-methylase UbiE
MTTTTDHDRLKGASPTDWRAEYQQKYYSGPEHVRHHWPNFVRKHLRPGVRVLEIGGGPVDWTTGILREHASEIVGLDIDPVVQKNRLLDQAFVYDGGNFPLPSGRFDLAVSRWVNEHLPDPELHFREVERVLAPGGLYIFRTVNFFHYMAMCSRFVPHWLQVPLVRWLGHMGPDVHDPYPTHYRVNSRGRIESLSRQVGLIPASIEMSEGYPSYGKAFKALFFVFMGYERLVNSSSRFEGFRHTIDCAVRKPELAADKKAL